MRTGLAFGLLGAVGALWWGSARNARASITSPTAVLQRIGKAPSKAQPKRAAILVAVRNYDDKHGTAPLPLSYSDTVKLRSALLRQGYSADQITVITDAPDLRFPDAVVAAHDADRLRLALGEALTRARDAGVEYLVFAFSGHGFSTGGESSREVLLPARFDLGVSSSYLRVDHLLLQLSGVGETAVVPHLLALLDVQRNPEAGRSPRAEWTLPAPREGQTITVLTASRSSGNAAERPEPAPDPQGSPFIDGVTRLMGRREVSTWIDFQRELRKNVVAPSRLQTPVEAGDRPKEYLQEPSLLIVPPGEANATFGGFFVE